MRRALMVVAVVLFLGAGCGGASGGERRAGASGAEASAPVYEADAVGACIGFDTGTVRDFDRSDEGPARAVVSSGWGGFYDEKTRISFFVLPDAEKAAAFLKKWESRLSDDAEIRANAVLSGHSKLSGEDRHLVDTCLRSG